MFAQLYEACHPSALSSPPIPPDALAFSVQSGKKQEREKEKKKMNKKKRIISYINRKMPPLHD